MTNGISDGSFLRSAHGVSRRVDSPSPTRQLADHGPAPVPYRHPERRLDRSLPVPQRHRYIPTHLRSVPRSAQFGDAQHSLVHQPRAQPRRRSLRDSRETMVSRVPPLALRHRVGAREYTHPPGPVRCLAALASALVHRVYSRVPRDGARAVPRRATPIRADVLGELSPSSPSFSACAPSRRRQAGSWCGSRARYTLSSGFPPL